MPDILSILNVIIPVFAIIALGYGAVRFRLFPAEGTRGEYLLFQGASFVAPGLESQAGSLTITVASPWLDRSRP